MVDEVSMSCPIYFIATVVAPRGFYSDLRHATALPCCRYTCWWAYSFAKKLRSHIIFLLLKPAYTAGLILCQWQCTWLGWPSTVISIVALSLDFGVL